MIVRENGPQGAVLAGRRVVDGGICIPALNNRLRAQSIGSGEEWMLFGNQSSPHAVPGSAHCVYSSDA